MPYKENPNDAVLVLARRMAIAKLDEVLRATEAGRRFSDEQLERMYTTAYSLIGQRRFREAQHILALLLTYRPLNVRYVIASGHVHEQLTCLEQSARCFHMALLLDPDTPAAKRFFKQYPQHKLQAAISLEKASQHNAGEVESTVGLSFRNTEGLEG